MTPTELRNLLEPLGIRPLKDRSQHFLLDEKVVTAMVDAAGVEEGTPVLEIGPGPGILTADLLRRGADVVAIEIDKKLCTVLRERFGAYKNFHLIEGDVLDPHLVIPGLTRDPERKKVFPNVSGSRVKPGMTIEGHGMTVVANLPYAITSAILQKFLLESPAPSSITVMIQKEVADRILAKPGDMSSLAVLVQTFTRVQRVRNVAAGAFFPPPKVVSTVIHMERRSDEELAAFFGTIPSQRYFDIVRRAFSERRKQLRNSLKIFAKIEKALVEAKIAPSARPEELSIAQWSALARALVK